VLEQLGLVRAIDHSGDQRRRLVELTKRGRDEAAELTRFNARLERAMREVLDEGSGSADAFLGMLDTVARSLDREPLSTRLNMKVDA
jgi:DNA-binding MarR family transcriptional regulator